MSDLIAFAAHCRKMAAAEHKTDCASLTWSRWDWPRTPQPTCDGCNPAADRALFAQLADEVDAYLERPVEVDLFGDASAEPRSVDATADSLVEVD